MKITNSYGIVTASACYYGPSGPQHFNCTQAIKILTKNSSFLQALALVKRASSHVSALRVAFCSPEFGNQGKTRQAFRARSDCGNTFLPGVTVIPPWNLTLALGTPKTPSDPRDTMGTEP